MSFSPAVLRTGTRGGAAGGEVVAMLRSLQLRPASRQPAAGLLDGRRRTEASTSYGFHTSAKTEGVRPAALKKERIRRGEKEAAELREVRNRMEQLTRPDPVLGHQINESGDKLWAESELNRIIISKETAWGVREDRRGHLVRIEEADSDGPSVGPKRLNFGLDNEQDRALLFTDLPAVIVEDKVRASSSLEFVSSDDIEAMSRTLEADEQTEREHTDQLSRILDLRNASGKGIQVENIRRIVNHFGAKTRADGSTFIDSGSSETQAAVLTYRIRNLHEHLLQARHDNHNRRGMTMLVHQRAKILKYLRRTSPARYEQLLPRLGLERRAVEGEVIVPGKPRMTMSL